MSVLMIRVFTSHYFKYDLDLNRTNRVVVKNLLSSYSLKKKNRKNQNQNKINL